MKHVSAYAGRTRWWWIDCELRSDVSGMHWSNRPNVHALRSTRKNME